MLIRGHAVHRDSASERATFDNQFFIKFLLQKRLQVEVKLPLLVYVRSLFKPLSTRTLGPT